MQAGQRLIASDNKEVCLFFMPYMNISQGENEGSHVTTWNIDYLGWNTNGRVYNALIYAPCSCTCVYAEDGYNAGKSYTSAGADSGFTR